MSKEGITAYPALPDTRRITRSAPPATVAKPLNLVYVSPKLPALSTTFEQNELLGLMACDAEITILSCRATTILERERCHDIYRALLPLVKYPSIGGIVGGVIQCLLRRPWVTVTLAARAVLAAATHPARARQHLGAFILAVGFAPAASRKRPDGIHADFVQGSATVAWYLSELLRVPFTMTAHAFDIYSRKPGVREQDAFFRRKTAAASTIFVAHDFGRRWLAAAQPEMGRKFRVHRVSVRVSDIQPLPYPTHATRPLIVALGRLEPKKGFDQLVRAMALLQDAPNAHSEIYGSGDQETELVQLAKKLRVDDRVKFCGAYRQEELPRIFQDAVCLVVPSVIDSDGDMDGIPTVIYEAMAFARPVIASAVSGIPEVVQNRQTGLLVETGKPDKLAEAIADLISDRDRARRMGLAARVLVSREHDFLVQSRLFARGLTAAYRSGS